MSIQIIASEDGSHTLYLPELNETYHSHKGALTESRHVFIKEGFDYVSDKFETVKILEVGFGTGLNAILTLIQADESGKETLYHTLEPFPLPNEIVEKLNYKELLPQFYTSPYYSLHSCDWDVNLLLSNKFNFRKFNSTLQEFVVTEKYNLIYFDAFAPGKQPDVWEVENLKKCFDLLMTGGILITYCAQGQFKRNLKQAGFEIQTLQGPPGKKEMTRGIRNS